MQNHPFTIQLNYLKNLEPNSHSDLSSVTVHKIHIDRGKKCLTVMISVVFSFEFAQCDSDIL